MKLSTELLKQMDVLRGELTFFGTNAFTNSSIDVETERVGNLIIKVKELHTELYDAWRRSNRNEVTK